jgi:hypothetical protein
MEKFKNLYPINKTLRFELRPYGKTLKNFHGAGLLEKDESKAKNRKSMQSIIDRKFKLIIEEKLKYLVLDEEYLKKAFSEDRNEREIAIISLKNQIVNIFNDKKFKENYLMADKNIKIIEKEYAEENIIQEFNRFTTYFVNFFDIRKHVFLGNTAGSIAFRLIDENLKIYRNNVEKIKKLPDELKVDLKDIDKINDIFLYNNFCTQSAITEYNEILGGISLSEGKKLQGINEKINLYCQKNKKKLPRLDQLYKMILSDRETSSFVLDVIENDEELIQTLMEVVRKIALSNDMVLSENDNIFIKYNQLGNLPGINHALISNLILEAYDKEYGNGKRKKSYEEDRKKFVELRTYSILALSDLLKNTEIDLVQNIKTKYVESLDEYRISKEAFENVDWCKIENIKQSGKTKVVKEVLDSLKDIQRFYNLFDIVYEDKNPNPEFYLWLSENMEQLGFEFNSVYNKTRNYLTKKQYSDEKFKLNFDSPTLAKGWDVNKEIDNSAFILRKYNNQREDYDYFLGVWNKNITKKDKVTSIDNNGFFEKMQYKLYPDPSKMLPKQFLSRKWNDKYPVTAEFESKYKEGRHKKGDKFDKEFLHELIDRYKHGLVNHEEKYQEIFGFKFRDTKDYNSYTEFLEDVEKYNYNVSFEKVGKIDTLVDEGKLYLFRIWSKDFSEYSKGTKNLNTIYFESLFSKENLDKKIFKLSGEAEIFYRRASLKYDEEKLKKGHHYEELKDKFAYPIIKDKRYSEDKFLFHVPMVINFKSENLSPRNLNERVNNNIKDFTHILGIDRGERHLVYLSVIEIDTGEIVEQKHLDEIINRDSNGNEHKTSYLQKLEERSKTRDNERKTWETIETIKELKDGYISQVVNEIFNLQNKYKALIVMENLNYGFKRSRFKVEKQVYQKFETALIKKLNYVIDKKDQDTYLKGYQLTNPVTTLDKIGSQSGVIFYIPAWNTSKIDPITGFVNLLNGSDLRYQNLEQAKEFIAKIDKIYYENGEYKFDIDFAKWSNRLKNSRTKWTLTSYGKRIETYKDPAKNNKWCSYEIELTEEFSKILNINGTLKVEDVRTYKRFMQLFKLMLQIRNSETGTDKDYMISPVLGNKGFHFDSREVGKKLPERLPKDADANGAYNIARKGLMVVENIINGTKEPAKISNEDYLIYMQK